MYTNTMKKDSRRQPIEEYQNSDISLTSSFFTTNIIESPWRDLKVKTKELIMPEEKFTYPNFPEDLKFKEPHFTRYIKFIESRESREIPEGTYTEKHHIVPRSLGGSDEKENLIVLTAREHFVIHMILWKCFGLSMAYAFFLMQNIRRYGKKINSRQYTKLKEDFSLMMSLRVSGEGNPMYGKVGAMNGRRQTKESIKKLSDSLMGHHVSVETRQKICNANKGNKHSQETRQKLSEMRKGEKNHFYEKHHTEENKEINRQKHIGTTTVRNKDGNMIKVSVDDPRLQTGELVGPNKGRIYITNGEENKMIDKDDEIPEGWWKGKIKKNEDAWVWSDEKRKQYSERFQGTTYINNGVKNKRIPKEELDNYLTNGWKKCRMPFK
jgi:hypothetical protein